MVFKICAVLYARQEGNSPTVIQYADTANERLRWKYYRLTLSNGKNANVAKTAIARELACFIWGMMTENYTRGILKELRTFEVRAIYEKIMLAQ